MRSTWEGHLKLSLVMCPVALYKATDAGNSVSFNLLHKDTLQRIKMVTTEPSLGPVPRSDLVKGYEYEKGRYVVLSEDEIKSVKLESNGIITIERFVDEKDIDRIYWDTPYYLAPTSDAGVEAFTVIREAMRQAGKVALGRVVMSARERIVALEPRDKGILLTTLRAADEVRGSAEAFDDIPDTKIDPAMLDLATRIIAQQEGPFEPAEFKDRYADALHTLINQKVAGVTPEAAPEPAKANVVNLIDALKQSLSKGGEQGERAERYTKSRVGRGAPPVPPLRPPGSAPQRRAAAPERPERAETKKPATRTSRRAG